MYQGGAGGGPSMSDDNMPDRAPSEFASGSGPKIEEVIYIYIYIYIK